MQIKKILGLSLILLGITSTQVFANSTIYTDDLGRMHFLGKDPGAKTLQKIEDYSNPKQKEFTNTTYTNITGDGSEIKETKVSETKVNEEQNAQQKKMRGSFTSQKGAMDASNPYNYGGTNVKPKDPLDINDGGLGKKFWQIW